MHCGLYRITHFPINVDNYSNANSHMKPAYTGHTEISTWAIKLQHDLITN